MNTSSRALLCLITAITILLSLAASAQSAIQPANTEDLSSSSVASSHLRTNPPELSEKTEEAHYIREWVTVSWRPNDPIYLYVVRPKNVSRPTVLIYLYDYPSETDIFRDDDWCERTTSGGYAAVGFVPALNGQRYHNRPMNQWFVSELQESLAKSSHDVQMVLDYLAQRGDVDVDNVGIFGVGAGGTIAVIAASADSRIKTIDLVDPWGDWPEWMAKSDVVPDEERPAYLKPQFLNKIAGFDPIALLPHLRTPHIRLTERRDGSTPIQVEEAIAAALPPGALRVRAARLDITATSNGQAFDWLKQQLRYPVGKWSFF